MRIAHMILSRGFAGTERATAEMCNAHCHQHPVLLLLRRSHRAANGVSIRDWLDPAVQVVELPDWFPRRALERALADSSPDIIHAHLRRSTRLLSRLQPTAATIATLHLTVNGPHFADMDGLICIADWQRRDLPSNYRGQVFFINESIIPARRLSTAEIASLRAELGVAPEQYLVGGVGRLAQSKGFDLLIEAFRRATLSNARLVIMGEGRERKRLQPLADERVLMPGFRQNVKDYYQAFDLFVSPSRREPLGRVILEALDAGVPLVSTATEGPSEILRHYGGELVPIGDIDALAAALERAQHRYDPRTPADLAPYHIDAVAAQTLAAYESVVRGRRS